MALGIPWPLVPMLAKAAPAPPADDARWSFETKWDGIRILARLRDGAAQLMTRNLIDATARYPELVGLGDALPGRSAVLDGEVVGFDAAGRATFEALQQRRGTSTDPSRPSPLAYIVFDVLELEGRSLLAVPYEERRNILEGLALEGPSWRTPPVSVGGGEALLATTREKGLEGIIAKRLGSPYEPGGRPGTWLKIKHQRRQEFVVGGWMPGAGRRTGTVGALLIGYFEAGELVSAGKVGTGFSDAMLAELAERLAPLARETSPFTQGAIPPGAHFVEPHLVGEVEFTEWTSKSGQLRHPSFKGLRFDKRPQDVVREKDGG